jgi:hypothetical protein
MTPSLSAPPADGTPKNDAADQENVEKIRRVMAKFLMRLQTADGVAVSLTFHGRQGKIIGYRIGEDGPL